MLVVRQTWALVVLVLRYWARSGLPNRLRKDHGRRASGAILRATFFVLMINWGYRIGAACVRVEPDEIRAQAVAWMLAGLFGLSMAWGAMGRGPGMRGSHSPMTSPLLDALPLSEKSRVLIGLFERVMLYALSSAALYAVTRSFRIDAALVGIVLPTAGLLVGDAALRLLRTVVSPARMARASTIALVAQFPAFMVIGGAPVLAKMPRAGALVSGLLGSATALVEGRAVLPLLGVVVVLGCAGAVGIRIAERIGYDRIDIVPTTKLDAAPSDQLDLVRIERVLAKREPGGRWLARAAFLYTAATSGGLLAIAYLSRSFAAETATVFVRSLGYVAIFAGFAVVQARAGRMVIRDAGARAMLSPLPIAPSDLLHGKTRALVVQALIVAAPYLLLVALPGPMSLRIEVLWRGGAALVALVVASNATVAVAFLTQGLGGVRVMGGNVGIETTLVAMPLLAVAAAPYPWSAVVSLACLALLAFEARRSALRCVRWIDDSDDFERETPIWRALLVFASFQAAETLGRRALALAPIDEHLQASLAHALAALVLLALTLHGRRGLPRMPVIPARAWLWAPAAVLAGAAAAGGVMGYRAALRALGVAIDAEAASGSHRLVTLAITLVVLPVVSEMFFRGWLQTAIEGELAEHRRWLAPLLAAFAFAAVRPPLAFLPALLLGLTCGILQTRSRGVSVPILAHVTYVALLLAASASR